MSDSQGNPTTLLEAIRYFSNSETCIFFVANLRWPDGVECPRCGGGGFSWLKTRHLFKCKTCTKQYSVKVGTIFEDSAIGLDKWLTAMWLMVNCKNGVSSCEIARSIGVTQKSAWFMLHRIRRVMKTGSFKKMSGEVEVDETFIGGKARNMHVSVRNRRITGTGTKDKVAVIGLLERGGEVRTSVVPSRRKPVLQSEVRQNVEAGSALYTDALLSYEGLASEYAHQVVDHAVEYVNGRIHTNGLENFWSLLKRGISGTYVSVEPFHLSRYLDEQTFRYNNRNNMNDGDRFRKAVGRIGGKRLTLVELTGKTAN
jgi:transposase-like protein